MTRYLFGRGLLLSLPVLLVSASMTSAAPPWGRLADAAASGDQAPIIQVQSKKLTRTVISQILRAAKRTTAKLKSADAKLGRSIQKAKALNARL